MTVRQPCYSKEEFARRGDELYETQVRIQEGALASPLTGSWHYNRASIQA